MPTSRKLILSAVSELEGIARDLEQTHPDGTMHSHAAKILGVATMLKGHQPVPSSGSGSVEVENDEDFVPVVNPPQWTAALDPSAKAVLNAALAATPGIKVQPSP